MEETAKTVETTNISVLFESATNQAVDRIIVADDQALNIETISRLLEKHGVL
jgi:PleD family two-component response regulator